MTLKNFDGAVAVVTGGASGIGLATAHALRAKGSHVVLADINQQGLQQAETQVRQHLLDAGGQVMSVVTDVTDASQVEALLQQTFAALGRVDLVVTCAGVGRGGPIDLFTAEEMQTMMNINFMGTFHCLKAALPIMRQQQEGHFVFLSSVAGKLGVPLLSGYCASKWAVRGFASAVRTELHGTDIGITTVYPSWVDTPMVRQEANVASLLNIEVLLTPDQVASEILQAVAEDKRDLTLSPNTDTSFALQIMKDDPDIAERVIGESFHQRLEQFTSTHSS